MAKLNKTKQYVPELCDLSMSSENMDIFNVSYLHQVSFTWK